MSPSRDLPGLPQRAIKQIVPRGRMGQGSDHGAKDILTRCNSVQYI
jgi:hypothetical protein